MLQICLLVELCSYVFVQYGVSSMTFVCWSVHRCKYHSFLCQSCDTIYAPRAPYIPSVEGKELVDEDDPDLGIEAESQLTLVRRRMIGFARTSTSICASNVPSVGIANPLYKTSYFNLEEGVSCCVPISL